MIRLKDILKEAEAEQNQAMITGVAEILRGVDDMANRKTLAFNMMDKFRREGVPFQKQQFLSMCGIPGSMMIEAKLNEAKEYVIWGIPPGKTHEDILYTKAETISEARKVVEILTKKHGCKKVRIQVLDLSQDTDFSQEFGKAVNVREADSPTERTRRYNRKNKKKVRAYLKSTQDDRVARNRDRAKAVKKNGEAKMKNKDVHHPNGPHGGSWRSVKKNHGPDKKK
jgi:Fe2+ transport system protein B